jgi:TonB family protein
MASHPFPAFRERQVVSSTATIWVRKYYRTPSAIGNKIAQSSFFEGHLGEEFPRGTVVPSPMRHLVNALDRPPTQTSATQSTSQTAETSVSQTEQEEVPIGIVEIPIGVCGSRRVASDLECPGRKEVFAEETSTVIVFPYGAVIRLSAVVAPGQMVMVANRKSAQVIPCRVVKAKNYPNVKGYAEIEFFRSTSSFWGAYIPQGTLKRMAGTLPTSPEKATEDFWNSSAGNQTDLLLANLAPANSFLPASVRNKVESIQTRAIPKPFPEKLAPRVVKTASVNELRYETAKLNVYELKPISAPVLGNASKVAAISTHEQSRGESAGGTSAIRSESKSLIEQVSGRRRMILSCAAAVIFLVAGVIGISLLRHDTGQTATTAEINSTGGASAARSTANMAESEQRGSDSNSAVPAVPFNANTADFPGARTREYADNVRGFQPPLRSSLERKIPNRKPLAAPLVPHRSLAAMDREAPPNLKGAYANNGASASAIASLLPSGGRMKEAQLILKSAPNYPATAKQVRVEGDVTVEAVIDITGKLSNMKVVSGQPLLQQAALDSLRTWKYEPAYLNDKPVPVQTSITVKFRLR